MPKLANSALDVLRKYSTCTVSNAIELFELRPRNEGFLRTPFHCLLPEREPIAGFAATCQVSAFLPDSYGRRELFEYWEQLEQIGAPSIAVVQDIDDKPRTGSFFGEVNASVHLALGCVGAVVDGAVRDLVEMRACGFQVLYAEPSVSHSYIHPVDFGKPLLIDGVTVRPGDLLQVDQHGVLIVPTEILPHLEEAVVEIERRERPVIEYCRKPGVTRQGLIDVVTRHLRNAPAWKPGQKVG